MAWHNIYHNKVFYINYVLNIKQYVYEYYTDRLDKWQFLQQQNKINPSFWLILTTRPATLILHIIYTAVITKAWAK